MPATPLTKLPSVTSARLTRPSIGRTNCGVVQIELLRNRAPPEAESSAAFAS